MTKNFGISDKDYQIIKSQLSQWLKPFEKYQIFIFGSRAKGKEKKYSDLDLWIESQPALTKHDIVKFAKKMEDSEISIKIDIVTPETCLEEYKDRILAEKTSWTEFNK